MPDIFLSYSRDDRLVMHVLRDNLRKLGFNVWIDEEGLTVGTPDWTRAIEQVGAMVVILTPAAKESHWVNVEIVRALKCKKPIFPVLASGNELSAIPIALDSAQYADMRGRADYEGEFRKLVEGLAKHFRMTVSEFSMDFSGQPRVQVQVHGDMQGTLIVVGRDFVDQTPAAPPAPEPPPPVVERRKPFEPEMVLIPAGPFLMGSPKSDKLRYDDEPEQFELNLDYDYAIGKYPVTVRLYRAFVDARGYSNDDYWTDAGLEARAQGLDWIDGKWQATGKPWTQPRLWEDKKWTGDPELPVIGVSWYEAYAYTCWLAEAAGRAYRLLTEAEWEKAARGGLQIPHGRGGMKKNPNPARIWPWGDEQPTKKLCNFEGNTGQTGPVTSHAAQAERQPYGLYHMAGNVWEWCLSKWASPFTYPEDNDPAGDGLRVLRGGSWYLVRRLCRASFRYWNDPGFWGSGGGFRVGGVVPVLSD